MIPTSEALWTGGFGRYVQRVRDTYELGDVDAALAGFDLCNPAAMPAQPVRKLLLCQVGFAA